MDRGPLGQMLYDRRMELGISQAKASVQLDTNPETYRLWESGSDLPRRLTWIAPLAEWLDKPLRWVVYACGLLDEEEHAILVRELGGYLLSAA